MYRQTRRLLATSTLISAALLAGPASAATDGTTGATSQGSLSITASVPARVRISGLRDVTFASVDPTLNASDAQNVCVWSNTGTKGYKITATGSGSGQAFTLAAAGQTAVPYTVQWAQTSGQTSGTSLTTATALTGQTSSALNANCTGGGPATTASLVVGMASSTLQSMTAGIDYTGTLTLVIAPE